MAESHNHIVRLKFEEVKLPQSIEILVVGKNSFPGKMAVLKSLELLSPDSFETIESDHDMVEAVIVNKKVLRKLSKKNVGQALAEKVFPFISEGELLMVELKTTILGSSIEL